MCYIHGLTNFKGTIATVEHPSQMVHHLLRLHLWASDEPLAVTVPHVRAMVLNVAAPLVMRSSTASHRMSWDPQDLHTVR